MRRKGSLQTIMLDSRVHIARISRYRGQRGHGYGSVLSGLFRSAIPMLKRIGKQALTPGAHVASDMLSEKRLGILLVPVYVKV